MKSLAARYAPEPNVIDDDEDERYLAELFPEMESAAPPSSSSSSKPPPRTNSAAFPRNEENGTISPHASKSPAKATKAQHDDVFSEDNDAQLKQTFCGQRNHLTIGGSSAKHKLQIARQQCSTCAEVRKYCSQELKHRLHS